MCNILYLFQASSCNNFLSPKALFPWCFEEEAETLDVKKEEEVVKNPSISQEGKVITSSCIVLDMVGLDDGLFMFSYDLETSNPKGRFCPNV